MTSAVTHFEIYAEDPAKLAEFYRALLGWQVEEAPGIDYWRIDTGAGESKGIGGGLLYRPIPGPRSWVHYLHVESLEQTVERIVELGGTLVRPKTAVPNTAWSVVVADPVIADLVGAGGGMPIRAAGGAGMGSVDTSARFCRLPY